MTERRRLLNVITNLNNGGAERMLLRLSRDLRPYGYESEIVSMRMGGELREQFEDLGIKVHELCMQNKPASLAKILRYREIEQDFKPHLVQGWLTHANCLVGLAGQSRNVPVIWNVRATLYGLSDLKPLSAAVLLMSSAAARRASAILYNSALGRKQHERFGYPSDRGHVIENGFDLDCFRREEEVRLIKRCELNVDDNDFVVGMFARYDPQKGHEDFVRAVSKLSKIQKLKFIMVGNEIDQGNEALMSLAKGLGVSDRISFLGHRRDVNDLMNAVDLNVLPSRFGEGYPNVVGEAMACETPSVVSDIAEQGDIVGDTGWVFPKGDVVGLANCILAALDLPKDEFISMGEAARIRISARNSMAAITKRYDALYRGLLKTHQFERQNVERLSA